MGVETTGTVLVLSTVGVAPWSARDLQQTLEPIQSAAVQRRTTDGELVDLSDTSFRKFATTITCTDMMAPALNGVWPGMIFTVDCAAELSYKTAGGSPDRPVVSGSSYTDGDFTFYRPQLTMMVTGFTVQRNEWQAAVGWTLTMEEV